MSFIQNVEWRRAVKTFDQATASDVNVEPIIHAIHNTPSSFGVQPYKIIVVTDPELKKKLRAAAWNQAQIEESTHLFVFTVRTDVKERVEEFIRAAGIPQQYGDMIRGSISGLPESDAVSWATSQAYIALGFGLAAAAELKIASCPMEGFDKNAFAELLQLPANLKPVSLLAVGKQHPDDSKANPFGPRWRFPREDLFKHMN